MFSRRSVVPPAFLLAAVLVSACDDRSPLTPSPPILQPDQSTAPDLSHLLGEWDLTLRLTEVSGGGCLAEDLESQIGVPNRYSMSVKQGRANTVDVTLTSASGDYSCTFPSAVADGSGPTTALVGSNPTCVGGYARRAFRCEDGTLVVGMSGQRISARVSGAEISGEWSVAFYDAFDYAMTWAETKAEFTGSR